jgi:hypothetical protein
MLIPDYIPTNEECEKLRNKIGMSEAYIELANKWGREFIKINKREKDYKKYSEIELLMLYAKHCHWEHRNY